MSYPGRCYLAEYDRLEPDADFWSQWMDRLHPDEVRAILDEDRPIEVIKRPVKPTWPVGEWIEIRSQIDIRFDAPRLVKGKYRSTFELDDRREGRLFRRPLREDPDNVTTIQLFRNRAPDEPERVPHSVVKRLPSTVRAKENYERERSEDTRRRLSRSVIEQIREAKLSEAELARVQQLLAEIEEERRLAA